MAHDDDIEALQKAASSLMARFDSVQIFCTRQTLDEGGTVNVNHGQGNWFARYGQIKWWLDRQYLSHQREDRDD